MRTNMGPKPRPLAERFWEKVDMSGGPDACWPWRASRDRCGYGSFGVGSMVDGTRRKAKAHRIAYELANPSDPLGQRECCHKCDNPPCCNPQHLLPGSQADNLRDIFARGRQCTVRGEAKPNALLSTETVRLIRRAVKAGQSQRKIAASIGVSRSAVQAVLKGRNWAHVQ